MAFACSAPLFLTVLLALSLNLLVDAVNPFLVGSHGADAEPESEVVLHDINIVSPFGLDGWSRPPPGARHFPAAVAHVGDFLNFTHSSKPAYPVYQANSREAFLRCDIKSAKLLSNTSSFMLHLSQAETLFFLGQSLDCLAGQKVQVHVLPVHGERRLLEASPVLEASKKEQIVAKEHRLRRAHKLRLQEKASRSATSSSGARQVSRELESGSFAGQDKSNVVQRDLKARGHWVFKKVSRKHTMNTLVAALGAGSAPASSPVASSPVAGSPSAGFPSNHRPRPPHPPSSPSNPYPPHPDSPPLALAPSPVPSNYNYNCNNYVYVGGLGNFGNGWTLPMEDDYQYDSVNLGDCLLFSYDPAYADVYANMTGTSPVHDVWLLTDVEAMLNCDFTGAVYIGSGPNVVYPVLDPGPTGFLHFSSSQGSNDSDCLNGLYVDYYVETYYSGASAPSVASSPYPYPYPYPYPPPFYPQFISVGDWSGWSLPFSGFIPPPIINVGDCLNFTQPLSSWGWGYHDVWQFPDARSWAFCDFSQAWLVGNTTAFLFQIMYPGDYYFASSQFFDCFYGLRIAVNVGGVDYGPPYAFPPWAGVVIEDPWPEPPNSYLDGSDGYGPYGFMKEAKLRGKLHK